ncbi:MAG: outer membrane protein assembly factor BamD [Proteobacteria bacterium]|nr:outer membrane protein assembly factor BamD [Pseudomonadota bacterium]
MTLYINRQKSGFIFKAFFLFVAVLFVSGLTVGCSSTKHLEKQRTAKELFDNALEAQIGERLLDAEAEYKKLMEEYPFSPFAVKAQLKIADLYFSREENDSAAAYYTNFVALHPSHPDAAYALFQKGMSLFKSVLGVDRDQTSTRKALFAFEDLRRDYKGSAYDEKAIELMAFLRRRLADRELYVAHFYFKNKKYKGALVRFGDILKLYPEVGLNPETLFYVGESYRKLGETASARETYRSLVDEYSDNAFAARARKALKRLGPESTE